MPVEPVTALSLLGVLITVAAQGVWGNRADALVCGGLSKLKDRLQGDFNKPTNHDVARAVFASFVQATHDSCESLLHVVQGPTDKKDLETLRGELPSPNDVNDADESLINQLVPQINAVIGGAENDSVRRAVLADRLTQAVCDWSEGLIGHELSPLIRNALATGLREGGEVAPPWTNNFRSRLAEHVKSDERFRAIIDAQNLASLIQSQAQQSLTLEQLLSLIEPIDLARYSDLAATGSVEFVAEGTARSLGFSHLRCEDDVLIASGQGFQLRVPTEEGHYTAVIEGCGSDWMALPVNGEGRSPFVLADGETTLLPPTSAMVSNELGVHRFLAISVDQMLRSQMADLMRGGAILSNTDQKELVKLLDRSPTDEYLISYGYMVVEP